MPDHFKVTSGSNKQVSFACKQSPTNTLQTTISVPTYVVKSGSGIGSNGSSSNNNNNDSINAAKPSENNLVAKILEVLQTLGTCNITIHALENKLKQAQVTWPGTKLKLFLAKHPQVFKIHKKTILSYTPCKMTGLPQTASITPTVNSHSNTNAGELTQHMSLLSISSQSSPTTPATLISSTAATAYLLTNVIPAEPQSFCSVVVSSLTVLLEAHHHISQTQAVAVDCEGVNLSATGKLCLVQIGAISTSKQLQQYGTYMVIYVIDIIVLSNDKNTFETIVVPMLQNIFVSENILKVFHDCRRDSEALFHQLGIQMMNISDTQVLYAMLVDTSLPQQDNSNNNLNSNTSLQKQRIGLNALLNKYKLQTNQLKTSIVKQMDLYSNFWERRPLTIQMVAYAASDVAMLLYPCAAVAATTIHYFMSFLI